MPSRAGKVGTSAGEETVSRGPLNTRACDQLHSRRHSKHFVLRCSRSFRRMSSGGRFPRTDRVSALVSPLAGRARIANRPPLHLGRQPGNGGVPTFRPGPGPGMRERGPCLLSRPGSTGSPNLGHGSHRAHKRRRRSAGRRCRRFRHHAAPGTAAPPDSPALTSPSNQQHPSRKPHAPPSHQPPRNSTRQHRAAAPPGSQNQATPAQPQNPGYPNHSRPPARRKPQSQSPGGPQRSSY